MPKYGINKAVLIGNLSTEPELRYTQQGHAVCNFRLATTERRAGADGNYRDVTDYHNIVLWRKKAEIAKEMLAVGAGVYLEGRIVSRNWTDREGQKRYTTEIEIDKMRMLDPAPAVAPSSPAEPIQPVARKSAPLTQQDLYDNPPF